MEGEEMEDTDTNTNQKQWAMRDSNPHSRDYESPALTIKLIAQSEKDVPRRYEQAKEVRYILLTISQNHHILDFVLNAVVVLNKDIIPLFDKLCHTFLAR